MTDPDVLAIGLRGMLFLCNLGKPYKYGRDEDMIEIFYLNSENLQKLILNFYYSFAATILKGL